MTRTLKHLGAAGTLALSMAMAPQAHAGTILGVDVADYIVMYEGGSSGSQLSINNFGTTGIWNGDIGIAGHGKLAATGPGTLDGDINFAFANTGQASISNTTVNGTVNYSVASVQTIMNNLNTLSSSLGALAPGGTGVAINTNPNQTIQVSSGTALTINGVNYDLFRATSVSTQNGENLIIKGDGSRSFVLDVGFDAQFHGNILLQDLNGKFFGDAGYAGLFPDQVLINLYNGAALTGGDTLDVNNNGNNAHPANVIYGDFLDPNGPISMVNTRFIGRVLGGDSVNMQIVSGDTITLPLSPPTPPNQQEMPEPGTLLLLGTALAGLGALGRRRWMQ